MAKIYESERDIYERYDELGDEHARLMVDVAELVAALEAVWEDWQIDSERYADSSIGPATVTLEPGEPPAATETVEQVRAVLAKHWAGEKEQG